MERLSTADFIRGPFVYWLPRLNFGLAKSCLRVFHMVHHSDLADGQVFNLRFPADTTILVWCTGMAVPRSGRVAWEDRAVRMAEPPLTRSVRPYRQLMRKSGVRFDVRIK